MREDERAVIESYLNLASDDYFAARPQIDTTDRRRVFEAGFVRAWELAKVTYDPHVPR